MILNWVSDSAITGWWSIDAHIDAVTDLERIPTAFIIRANQL